MFSLSVIEFHFRVLNYPACVLDYEEVMSAAKSALRIWAHGLFISSHVVGLFYSVESVRYIFSVKRLQKS